MAIRKVLLWLLYSALGLGIVGFASLFMRLWIAIPVGIAVAAGLLALPYTNPNGRN